MSDLLVVDVGNTTTRAGVWREGEVQQVSVVSTLRILESVDTNAELDAIAEDLGLRLLNVAISSVVPSAELIWARWCQEQGLPFLTIRGDTPTPLTSRYAEPGRLGPDRMANAVGAVRRLGAPVIVAGLGTATVVDAVSAKGEFLGGAIAVGLETGLAALADRTAALPRVEPDSPITPVGRDTEQCLQVGAVLGTAAAVEGLATRLREVIGEKAPLALTGGHAERVSAALRLEHSVFPYLTLEGIGAIWEHSIRGR